MMRTGILAASMAALAVLAGCQTNSEDQILASAESQVALRSMQSRAFETTDKIQTMRSVIATLQDLGFVVDKADDVLGTVSGTKLDGYQLRMTVTVRPRGETQMIVRANAQYNVTPVEEPGPYQQFFAALEKAMFLTAQQVD
ncbi:hypothetical protein M1105_09235 [Limibaculum sp. FT325]|uniref:hypothetical protein n=1 Tax=Thermohalobaculum sediminis TaxID=2939436 RepID=UPI0020BFD705|nr:hypothetical protein [Limibaculum sediminis]MCL5777168.1 hypothetical protein [Limibaculum sediminis]